MEESLSGKVIAYEQISKWDGVMPKVVSGDSNGMLISINPDDLDQSSSNQATANPSPANPENNAE